MLYLEPQFYVVNLGCKGDHVFFFISMQEHPTCYEDNSVNVLTALKVDEGFAYLDMQIEFSNNL